MRTFEHFNASFDAVCPVCNTSADAETILVPIPGTEEGGICEARQVHKRCFDLVSEIIAKAIRAKADEMEKNT